LGVKPAPMIESNPLAADLLFPAASVAVTRTTAFRVGAISGGTVQSNAWALPLSPDAIGAANVWPPSV